MPVGKPVDEGAGTPPRELRPLLLAIMLAFRFLAAGGYCVLVASD